MRSFRGWSLHGHRARADILVLFLITTAKPKEALSLSSYCQHIRRWEIPRSSYPEGLSGYKSWRISLNKYHTNCAFDVLEQSGYSQTQDTEIFDTVRDLLQKKTLRGGNDRGEEDMQIFEGNYSSIFHLPSNFATVVPVLTYTLSPWPFFTTDAICLTFLELEFSEFLRKHDEDKMVKIVQKTWGKMGARGRTYALDHLAKELPEEAQGVLGKALQG